MSAYCSMIHGGLALKFDENLPTNATAQNCCIIKNNVLDIDIQTNFWNNLNFDTMRNLNKKDVWDPRCFGCKNIENNGGVSMRTGMNQGLIDSKKTNFSGPLRIDVTFDKSCNLACRICGSDSSTYWQKHLREHGLWNKPIFSDKNTDNLITALSNIDLSNLKQFVFSGGETLLGTEYWKVTEWLANNVPNSKEQLTVCFQTNGTQPIPQKYFELIEKFYLVKLHISLDGIEEQFEYQRWPASWNQVTDNLADFKENLPSNVMFVVEETFSIFNLFYHNKVANWICNNFASNREGDVTNHTQHYAIGNFDINNITIEYKNAISKHLIKPGWQENPQAIKEMLIEIKKFDQFRNQSFVKTFPEVAEFYSRYLT